MSYFINTTIVSGNQVLKPYKINVYKEGVSPLDIFENLREGEEDFGEISGILISSDYSTSRMPSFTALDKSIWGVRRRQTA